MQEVRKEKLGRRERQKEDKRDLQTIKQENNNNNNNNTTRYLRNRWREVIKAE